MERNGDNGLFSSNVTSCVLINQHCWIVLIFTYSSGQKKVPVPFQNYERNTLDSNKDTATERKSSVITETLRNCARALP